MPAGGRGPEPWTAPCSRGREQTRWAGREAMHAPVLRETIGPWWRSAHRGNVGTVNTVSTWARENTPLGVTKEAENQS